MAVTTSMAKGRPDFFALLRSIPSAIDALDTLYEPNAVFSQYLVSASMTFFSSFPCFLFLLYLSCVIRLSLGKLLVNQLQVVKRTNTPLIP